MNPDDFWSPWESTGANFDEVRNLIHGVFDKWSAKGRVFREWEDRLHRPWPKAPANGAPSDAKTKYREWRTQVSAGRPPHFDGRMAAQNGGFIFGGVPYAGDQEHPQQWPKSTSPADGKWKIDEVRRATSLGLHAHKLDPQAGGVTAPWLTLRTHGTNRGGRPQNPAFH